MTVHIAQHKKQKKEDSVSHSAELHNAMKTQKYLVIHHQYIVLQAPWIKLLVLFFISFFYAIFLRDLLSKD